MPILRSFAGAAAASVAFFAATGAAFAADTIPPEVRAMHERSVTDGECLTLDSLLTYYKATIATLSDTDTLYVLPCQTGIINTPWRLYVVSTGDRAGVRPLMFAQFDQDFSWIADDLQFNPTFDPATRTLKARQFFAPAGDCGEEGIWAWRDYAFAMVSYRFQGICDRTHTYADWPTIWQEPKAAEASPPRPQVGDVPSFFQSP